MGPDTPSHKDLHLPLPTPASTFETSQLPRYPERERVIKIGGGCLDTHDDYVRASQAIEKLQPYGVIVSAAKGVTNSLIALLSDVESGRDFSDKVEALKIRHLSLLNRESGNLPWFQDAIEQTFVHLWAELRQLDKTTASSGVAYAKVVTKWGEDLSALILHSHMPTYNVWHPSRSLKVQGDYRDGRVNFDDPYYTERRFIPPPPRSIIPGFYGVNENGERSTLGRGGSDLSDTEFSRLLDEWGLKVESYLMKDTKGGILPVNPKLNPELVGPSVAAIPLHSIQDMAAFGASVLHPAVGQPLVGRDIPFEVRCIATPTEPGTRFLTNERLDAQTLAILGRPNCTWLEINSFHLHIASINENRNILQDLLLGYRDRGFLAVALPHSSGWYPGRSVVLSKEVEEEFREEMSRYNGTVQPVLLDAGPVGMIGVINAKKVQNFEPEDAGQFKGDFEKIVAHTDRSDFYSWMMYPPGLRSTSFVFIVRSDRTAECVSGLYNGLFEGHRTSSPEDQMEFLRLNPYIDYVYDHLMFAPPPAELALLRA